MSPRDKWTTHKQRPLTGSQDRQTRNGPQTQIDNRRVLAASSLAARMMEHHMTPPSPANLINCHVLVLAASSLAARMMEYDPPPSPANLSNCHVLAASSLAARMMEHHMTPPFCANLINCHVLAASSLAARMMEYDPPIPCKFNQLSRLGGQFTGGQDDGI